jgi:hypothetical protein
MNARAYPERMIVVSGEATIDTDGFLHGWCWCDAMPLERRVVEIMMNDRLVSAIVASRFRDDLRARNIGDGYNGFAVALTSSLTQAGQGCVLSVRDRASGEIFWRKTLGEFGLPDGLSNRIEDLALACKTISESPELHPGHATAPALRFAARLGQLGRYLDRPSKPDEMSFVKLSQARASLMNGHIIVPLPFIANPHCSMILHADNDASTTMQMISAATPALHSANAELLVLDSGADPRTPLLPSIFANLRYFAVHGEPAALRKQAEMAARGEVLIFL